MAEHDRAPPRVPHKVIRQRFGPYQESVLV